MRKVHKKQVSQVINTYTWYCFLSCPDALGDVWEDPIMTEPNKDNLSVERRNLGERLTTTEDGMYNLLTETIS